MDHLTVSSILDADRTAVLQLRGDLDFETATRLDAVIGGLPEDLTWIVLDLSDLDFLDSTGIMSLLRIRRSRPGTKVSVRYARESVLLALQTTQVLSVFDVEAPQVHVEATPLELDAALVRSTHTAEGALVLCLVGDLDAVRAPELIAAVTAALAEAPKRPIVLDLGRVRFLDSGGLSALHACALRVPGKLRLVNAVGPALRTIIIAGLDEHLDLDRPGAARPPTG